MNKAKAEGDAFAQKVRELEEVAIETRASLDCAEKVQQYLMSLGVWLIMEKIFASDEFAYYMAGLVPKVQIMGHVLLLKTLQE